jgi:hypothetical protein
MTLVIVPSPLPVASKRGYQEQPGAFWSRMVGHVTQLGGI